VAQEISSDDAPDGLISKANRTPGFDSIQNFGIMEYHHRKMHLNQPRADSGMGRHRDEGDWQN